MKQKSSKRITPNKSPRPSSISSIILTEPAAASTQFDMTETCFKANLCIKSHKLLKRDLLRGSDSRHAHFTIVSAHHRRSRSADAILSSPKIDPFGPWTNLHHSSLPTKKRDFSRPLKNSRLSKISNETSTFESSMEMSIEQYRKNKGYRLEIPRKAASSASIISTDTDRGTSRLPSNDTLRSSSQEALISSSSLGQNKLLKSPTDPLDHSSASPSIPSLTKILSVPYYIHQFPPVPMRNGHLRPTRHPPHHPLVVPQTVTLPALTGSSINYLNTLNSNGSTSTKTSSSSLSQSKLYFVHGRKKRKYVECVLFCSASPRRCL